MSDGLLNQTVGVRFLGGRARAQRIRLAICGALEAGEASRFAVDFSGCTGISHSAADELLTPLTETFGDDLPTRVTFLGCSDSVREMLEGVSDMHDLGLPRFQCSEADCTSDVKKQGDNDTALAAT